MPLIVRLFVRSALIWLMIGALAGAALLLDLLPSASAGALSPGLTHVVTVGWATQLIFGVALWMFPLLADRNAPRGPAWLSWAVYFCLNLGLVLRIIVEPLERLGNDLGAAAAVAAVLQTTAVWLFAATIWLRIRAKAARAAATE
jgi:hypothetical protein